MTTNADQKEFSEKKTTASKHRGIIHKLLIYNFCYVTLTIFKYFKYQNPCDRCTDWNINQTPIQSRPVGRARRATA